MEYDTAYLDIDKIKRNLVQKNIALSKNNNKKLSFELFDRAIFLWKPKKKLRKTKHLKSCKVFFKSMTLSLYLSKMIFIEFTLNGFDNNYCNYILKK